MKKLLLILLLLPFCMVSCRKDGANAGKTDGFNARDYVIQGKMKGGPVTDGVDKAYVIIFETADKLRLINVAGETEIGYTVQDDKILLNDYGYFNILNGSITGWVIAGLNISSAQMQKIPQTNQLHGKTFSGKFTLLGITPSVDITDKFDPVKDEFFALPEEESFTYKPYANIAGLWEGQSGKYFFVNNNGRLEVNANGTGVFASGTLNQVQ
jgi:hypothetical protein